MSHKQYQLFLITLIAAIAILLTAWTVHTQIQKRIEQNVGATLTTVLNTAHQAIQTWAQQEQAIVETWSDNLNIRQAADALLTVKPDQQSLLASPAQQALRDQLLPILMVKGYRGYFIIDKNLVNLASSRDVNVGSKSLLADEKLFLDRIWSGYSAMSEPVLSDVPLAEQNTRGHERSSSMFAGAPILNDRYEVVAAFVFRIDPYRDFTTILRQGRMGISGETYAFNQNGVMISLSRFDEQLHEIGLISGDDYDVSHRLTIRDPGVSLLEGEISETPRAEQPLTLMAQQALQKRNGINLKGYRDYRGVMVYGAWLWDTALQMGFATEIDADEASETARFMGRAITLFSVIITLLLVVLMLVFDRGRQRMAKQSRELRAIIEGSPVAMVVTDNLGNIEFFNRHFIQQYGWTTDDVRTPDEWWQAAYPDPEYRQQVQQGWEQAASEAQEQNTAIAPQYWSMACKNGTSRDTEFRMVPLSESLSVIAMVDLTERNRALRAIRFERDRAESYLDTVDVMILALDPSGTITEINRAGCELLGYEEEELIGRNWFDTCTAEDEQQRLKSDVHTPSVKGDEHAESYMENEIVTRSGERRLIAWHNAQLKDDKETVVGTLSAGTDITDIRRAEREREQLQSQLLRTQKAEAIGQLSAGVAHNFNNMFGAIIGFSELAKKKAAMHHDDDLDRYLAEVLNSSYRARDLVKQIQSFSRTATVNMQPKKVTNVLLHTMGLLQSALPSAVEIKIEADEEIAKVLADENQLQQVIVNLVTNASESMDGKGMVTIRVRQESGVEQACSACDEHFEGDYVVLDVEDGGAGMDAEMTGKIFEPFFSTKDASQGAGMGLPTVHGIVHEHQGHIHVESSLGKGTTMSVYLPVEENSAKQS